jgi:hypothetical protein
MVACEPLNYGGACREWQGDDMKAQFLTRCGLMVALVLSQAPALAEVITTQLGFTPDDPKSAVLTVDSGSSVIPSFEVVLAEDVTQVLHRGEASQVLAYPAHWIGSDLLGDTYHLDFSAAELPAGRYRIRSQGQLSAPFQVTDSIYDLRAMDPLGFFRIQGSAVGVTWASLDGTQGGHGPDHLDDARQATRKDRGGGDAALIEQDLLQLPGGRIDVSGGWSDAGDYNKYMGNTPWAAYLLLLMAEERPGYWSGSDTDGNGEPDLQQVTRHALDWMLKMQHNDGSTYERVFSGYSAAFDGRPDLATDNRIGTRDDRPLDTDRYADITAKSAYAWAVGYRVLGDTRYLEAARRAWQWAYEHPAQVKDQAYGGGLYFGDLEMGLALGALELHRAELAEDGSADPRYMGYATQRVAAHLRSGDWTNPSAWDFHGSMVLQRYFEFASSEDRQRILDQLGGRRDWSRNRQLTNAWRFNDEAVYGGFGQNDLSTAGAWDALWLFAQTGQRSYYDYAVDQMAWVFGRNPFGESWLASGQVSEYTRVPHWRATGKRAIEGVVVPGAADMNGNGLPDYADTGEWFYAEPTINQQAMFVRTMTELFHASGGSSGPPPNLPPTLNVLSPTAGLVATGSLDLLVTATDTDGVTSVTYSLDGGPASSLAPLGSDRYGTVLDSLLMTDGLHELTFLATDAGSREARVTVSFSVRNSAQEAMHVGDMEVTIARKGKSRVQGICRIRVIDSFGMPVPGATVNGGWSGAASDSFAVSTDLDGWAIDYSNSAVSAPGLAFTCTAQALQLAGWRYDAEANQVESLTAIMP